jgi:hypothetical protein
MGYRCPGAIAFGYPDGDVTKTGDSFYTNEFADKVLVSPNGFCDHAAGFYAHRHDTKNPLLSPVRCFSIVVPGFEGNDDGRVFRAFSCASWSRWRARGRRTSEAIAGLARAEP